MKREHAHKIPTGVYITGLVTVVGVFRLLGSHFPNLASAPFGYVSVRCKLGGALTIYWAQPKLEIMQHMGRIKNVTCA